MQSLSVAGLLLLTLTLGEATQGPVTKVVELIEELKAKIEADGKMEQQIYDKYACWCETTSARKANDIHTAMSDIKSLGTKILELKGLVATRESEIAQDSMDIQSNQAAQDEATGIRQKENAAYMAEKTEMETTLNALQRAIEVLSGAGKDGSVADTAPGRDDAPEHCAGCAPGDQAVARRPHTLAEADRLDLLLCKGPGRILRPEGRESCILQPGVSNHPGHPQGHVRYLLDELGEVDRDGGGCSEEL